MTSESKGEEGILPAAIEPLVHVPNRCRQPAHVIGVQPETPLAWSPGGQLAFAAGNRSIYLASQRPDGHFGIDVTLVGHTAPIRCLEFAPETPWILVSGGVDGLHVWDTRNGEQLLCFPSGEGQGDHHESDITCMCFAYGGSTLLTGSRDDKIKVWDCMNNYRVLETIHGHKAPLAALAFSETTGKLVSAGRDSTIKLWDAQTLHPSWRERRQDDQSIVVELEENMDGHMGDVIALALSSDGILLFSGARDNTIKVWDTRTNREIRTITGHQGDVKNILLFEGGEGEPDYLFSCSMDGHFLHVELLAREVADEAQTDLELIQGFLNSSMDDSGMSSAANALVLGPRDRISSRVRAHEQDVFAMAFNQNNNLLASSSTQHEVKIWDMTNRDLPNLIHDFVGHTEAVTSVSLLGNGSRLVSSSFDYNIHLYNVETIRRVSKFSCDGSILVHVVSPDERYIYAAGADYDIKVFDIGIERDPSAQDMVAQLEGHSGRVQTMAVTPDNSLLASAGRDFNLCLWKLPSQYPNDGSVAYVSQKSRVETHNGCVTGLDFSAHNPPLLASVGNDHAVRVWTVNRASLREHWCTENAHASVVSAVTWGTNASVDILFTGGWDSVIKAWTANPGARQGNCVAQLKAHTARITELQTSVDGAHLFSTAADYNCIQWSASSPFEPMCIFPGWEQDGVPWCVGVGPSEVVTGHENGVIKVWPQMGADNMEAYFMENTAESRDSRASMVAFERPTGTSETSETPVAPQVPQEPGLPQPLVPTAPSRIAAPLEVESKSET